MQISHEPMASPNSGSIADIVMMNNWRYFRRSAHCAQLIAESKERITVTEAYVLRVLWIIARLGPQYLGSIGRQLQLRRDLVTKLDSRFPKHWRSAQTGAKVPRDATYSGSMTSRPFTRFSA